MSKTQATDFDVGQRIVYPSQGVGKIIDLQDKSFKDNSILYYTIYLEFSDMTVMVPVDKAIELGIRAIVSKAEAERALDFIAEEYAPIPSDWKLRYQMNLDLLKKGSVMDIASVVRSLYHRSKIKELPILERKLYDSALNLLQDEIAFSLGKSKDEIGELIRSRLES
jgi:CarD family transcriptional regulator